MSCVFDGLADQGWQIVAHATDRSTVGVEAFGAINTKGRLVEGETPSRYFWEDRIAYAHFVTSKQDTNNSTVSSVI